jgi:hypothetical protein
MGMRRHLVLHEAAHGLGDIRQRVVQSAVGELSIGDPISQPGAGFGGIAALGQHAVMQWCRIAAAEPEVLKPDKLALVHRDSAGDLVQIFARGNLGGELFGLPETAGCGETLGILCQLAQHGGIGGEPGQSMRRVLFAVEDLARYLAARHNACRNMCTCLGEDEVRRPRGLDQVVAQMADHSTCRMSAFDCCHVQVLPRRNGYVGPISAVFALQ